MCWGGSAAQDNAKYRAAERLMVQGHPLQIINEDAFWRLVSGGRRGSARLLNSPLKLSGTGSCPALRIKY